jgi:hypothetical protein
MLYCFFNLTLILLIFLIFFLYPFVKILLVFNFIIQFKLTIYYIFQFDPHSFDFFYPFVQVSFLFSFTLRLEIYSFPMIYFLF